MKNVLVVGATGRIGREIVGWLSRRRARQVVAATTNRESAEGLFQGMPHVRTVELDLNVPATLPPALTGIDIVVMVSPMSPQMGARTQNVLAVAKQLGVTRVVRCSLLGVGEPDPIMEAEWHGDADEAVQKSGLSYTILRPNQYFQNFTAGAAAESVKNQGALYLPLADSRVSNIDTRDIGEIAAAVALDESGEHEGKAYTLTGPAAHTMAEYAEAVSTVLDKRVKFVSVDPEQTRLGMLSAGVPPVIVDAILGWFAYCRAGRAARVSDDTARLLGRAPRTMSDFVRDYAQRYR